MNPQKTSKWAVVGLYLFAFTLFFWPLADLTTNAIPIQLGNLQWRYGFGGLLAAFLQTPILGLVLAMATAFYFDHARAMRLLGVLQVVGSLGVLLVMGVFAMDLLQVRASRPEPAQNAVLAGGVIALTKHLSTAVVLGLLGAGAWGTGGRMRDKADKDRGPGVLIKPGKK